MAILRKSTRRKNLRRRKLTRRKYLRGGGDKCGICYEELRDVPIEQNPGILTLSCNHKFHHDCIQEWCSRSKPPCTCPVCRKHANVHDAKLSENPRWNSSAFQNSGW